MKNKLVKKIELSLVDSASTHPSHNMTRQNWLIVEDKLTWSTTLVVFAQQEACI